MTWMCHVIGMKMMNVIVYHPQFSLSYSTVRLYTGLTGLLLPYPLSSPSKSPSHHYPRPVNTSICYPPFSPAHSTSYGAASTDWTEVSPRNDKFGQGEGENKGENQGEEESEVEVEIHKL